MELRKPLFFVALGALALCFLVELGAPLILPRPVPDRATLQANLRSEGAADSMDVDELLAVQRQNPPTPGLGIPALALIDGLLLFTLVLMGASLLVPERVHGRLQGLATLAASLAALTAGFLLATTTLTLLLLMVALFTAAPFGTLAYLAVWGFFDRPGATTTLGLLMALKLGAGVCLVLANPRFLQNKGLVLLVFTSLLATALVSFLHGMVPLVLVSITDAVAALIATVLGLVWAVVLLVGALVSLVRVLRLKRTASVPRRA